MTIPKIRTSSSLGLDRTVVPAAGQNSKIGFYGLGIQVKWWNCSGPLSRAALHLTPGLAWGQKLLFLHPWKPQQASGKISPVNTQYVRLEYNCTRKDKEANLFYLTCLELGVFLELKQTNLCKWYANKTLSGLTQRKLMLWVEPRAWHCIGCNVNRNVPRSMGQWSPLGMVWMSSAPESGGSWPAIWGGVPLGGWSRRGKGLKGLCVGGPGSRPGFTAHQLCDGAPKPWTRSLASPVCTILGPWVGVRIRQKRESALLTMKCDTHINYVSHPSLAHCPGLLHKMFSRLWLPRQDVFKLWFSWLPFSSAGGFCLILPARQNTGDLSPWESWVVIRLNNLKKLLIFK